MADNSDSKKAASIYDFNAKDIDGNEVSIELFDLFNFGPYLSDFNS